MKRIEVTENEIIKPGDRLVISITFDADLDESEACHKDIVLEDFLASRNDKSWNIEIIGVQQPTKG